MEKERHEGQLIGEIACTYLKLCGFFYPLTNEMLDLNLKEEDEPRLISGEPLMHEEVKGGKPRI